MHEHEFLQWFNAFLGVFHLVMKIVAYQMDGIEQVCQYSVEQISVKKHLHDAFVVNGYPEEMDGDPYRSSRTPLNGAG